MTTRATELLVEDVALAYFDEIGIPSERSVELEDEGARSTTSQVLLEPLLIAAVQRLNPDLPGDAVDGILRTIRHPPLTTLIQNNRWFHGQLVDGVDIEYRDNQGQTRIRRARLVDFENPGSNDLRVVRQLTVSGSGAVIRPDLVVFLNGIPVVVIELKDPGNELTSLDLAVEQLQRYMVTAPDLFTYNVAVVVSDGMLTRTGSITSGKSRFMPWRSTDAGEPTIEAFIRGLMVPHLFVEYLRTCVVFEEDDRGEIAKKIAGYHQFRAVQGTLRSVLDHLKPPLGGGDGRGGVIWHTQGSGKSLTMLMLAGALIREPRLANPTIVMITDRNDLDDQLLRYLCRRSGTPPPGSRTS